MNNEITQEEREGIIANIESNFANIEGNCVLFSGPQVASAIQTNYGNDEECWAKLLALIESAPAKKNMRAVELADKLEAAYKENKGEILSAISKTLDYDLKRTTIKEDFHKLFEAIRNLDAPEDGMPWPLDKDGVPCKIGDIVFYKDYDFAIEYANDEYVVYSDYKGDMHEIKANEVTHKKPRTLDDIIREMVSAFYEDRLRIDLIIETI